MIVPVQERQVFQGIRCDGRLAGLVIQLCKGAVVGEHPPMVAAIGTCPVAVCVPRHGGAWRSGWFGPGIEGRSRLFLMTVTVGLTGAAIFV